MQPPAALLQFLLKFRFGVGLPVLFQPVDLRLMDVLASPLADFPARFPLGHRSRAGKKRHVLFHEPDQGVEFFLQKRNSLRRPLFFQLLLQIFKLLCFMLGIAIFPEYANMKLPIRSQ